MRNQILENVGKITGKMRDMDVSFFSNLCQVMLDKKKYEQDFLLILFILLVIILKSLYVIPC